MANVSRENQSVWVAAVRPSALAILGAGRTRRSKRGPGRGRGDRAGMRGGFEIGYTSVLLAMVVGIVHAGLSPEIEIAGVHPNLMLVAVVLVTALAGFG